MGTSAKSQAHFFSLSKRGRSYIYKEIGSDQNPVNELNIQASSGPSRALYQKPNTFMRGARPLHHPFDVDLRMSSVLSRIKAQNVLEDCKGLATVSSLHLHKSSTVDRSEDVILASLTSETPSTAIFCSHSCCCSFNLFSCA